MFLENVRVPVECRVGEENDGWRVTNVTLSFERGTAFASDMVKLQESVRELDRARPARSRATTPRPGRTARCAARSATWPPSSTRSGRW